MDRWPGRRPRRFSFGSNLRRAEWGMAGRHRRRTRRAAIAIGALAVLAGAAGVWAIWLRGGGGETHAPKLPPPCASAALPGKLGEVASVHRGRLLFFDLDECFRGTMLTSGVRPPVRFSPDGRLIAYGDGAVVPTRGGPVTHPLGRVATWEWSPSGQLAGVTGSGRVLVADPSERASTLIQKGAGDVAFSPTGRDLAVDLGNRLAVIPAEGGSLRTLFAAPKRDTVRVLGWAPGGKWVLFFVQHPHATSAQLNAAPVSGGGYHNVFDPVLPFEDFISSCGDTVVVSGGGAKFPSEGQQLLLSAPPLWQTHNLSADFRSSWIWPACSPDGRWIAVTVTPNHKERPPGRGKRWIELVGTRGQPRITITIDPKSVFEAPRWSSDGRVLLVVQRDRDPGSVGHLVLIRINPKTGKVLKRTKLSGELGPAPDHRGHLDWLAISDWYRR